MPNGVQKTDEIKEYAKELFMIPKKGGKHKLSFQKIADKVVEKFEETCSKNTIRLWAYKIEDGTSWDTDYKALVAIGIKEAELNRERVDNSKTAEEVYKDNLASVIRENYSQNLKMNDLANYSITVICASIAGELRALVEKAPDKKPENVTKTDILRIITDDDKKLLMCVKKDTDNLLTEYRDNSALKPIEVKDLSEMTDEELMQDDDVTTWD